MRPITGVFSVALATMMLTPAVASASYVCTAAYYNSTHSLARGNSGDERAPIDDLAAEEERVLRCLGAAVIMQWNMLPATLQQELFDNAGSLGPLRDVGELRAQIARFLQKHDQMCNDAAQLGLSK